MLKALIKKQIMEVFAMFGGAASAKKNKSADPGKKRVLRGGILMLAIFIMCGAAFGALAYNLCKSLCPDYTEMYFAISGAGALAFGVLGSVFMAKTQIYDAKDNDLLSPMPIPPFMILISRMIGLYAQAFLFSGFILVPAAVVYLFLCPQSVLSVLFCIIIPLIFPLLTIAICCLFGWVLAWLSSFIKAKYKSIIVTALALVFIFGYYFLYGKAINYIQYMADNAAEMSGKVKTVLFFFWQMGLAARGKVLPFVLFTLVTLGVFAIITLVLALNFTKIITRQKGERSSGKGYKKNAKTYNAKSALLRKELKRFVGSSAYMLNSGLGIIIMLIFSVVIFIRGRAFLSQFEGVNMKNISGLIVVIAACVSAMMAGSTLISAPSISLEGKSLWILRSLPIRTEDIFDAKIRLHVLLMSIPSLLFSVAVDITMRLDIISSLMLIIFVQCFVVLTAIMGLALNLKFPNLNWTNETVPIKQGVATVICMFGSWGVMAAAGALYVFVLGKFVPGWAYLMAFSIAFVAAIVIIAEWLKTRGKEIFENL